MLTNQFRFVLLITLQVFSINLFAAQNTSNSEANIQSYCKDLSKKLRTVKYQGCLDLGLKISDTKSVKGRLLTYREFKPLQNTNTYQKEKYSLSVAFMETSILP